MRLTMVSLALLPLLFQLDVVSVQGRVLLAPKDQVEQKQREAKEMAQQLETQEAWEASEMKKIRQRQRQEEKKLKEMIEEQEVREAEQMADQLDRAARKAQREGAAKVEQEQLEAKAREAKAVAKQKRAEKKKEKRADRKAKRKAQRAQEEEAAAAVAAAASYDGGDFDEGSDMRDGGSDNNNDGGSSSSRGDTGPIWGMEKDSGRKGGKGSVYATYHYYAPHYETSSLYCADAFAKLLPAKSDTPLLRYPWTAYCNIDGLGPMSQDKCGKCLKVTNPRTGESVKMLVVDMCGQGGIDMDPLGFNAIDGDKQGVADGHMWVDIEWC